MKNKKTIKSFSSIAWAKNRISVEVSSAILILSLGIIATLTDKSFVAFTNIINIADVAILYLMLGIGLTFVLLSGSVNLAIGGMLSLNCVIFALLSKSMGLWAIPVVLASGFIEGLLTGWVFNVFKIPSFIATFGMMGIFTSIAILLSGGAPIVLSGNVIKSLHLLHEFIFPGIKFQYLIGLAIFLLFLFVQNRTAYGKYVSAIGSSPIAVYHIGINIGWVKQLSYAFSGLSSAIGAILLSSKLYAGDPTVGASYLLLIVAVVIVGGTSLSGGIGGVVNTLLGAITIAVLQNSLQIMGVNIYYHPVIIGAVMILAVAISLDREKVDVVK